MMRDAPGLSWRLEALVWAANAAAGAGGAAARGVGVMAPETRAPPRAAGPGGAASQAGSHDDASGRLAPDPIADNLRDAVTVLRAPGKRPINKLVTRAANGTVTKAMAKNGGHFVAEVVTVPDLGAMADVLGTIGARPDAVLSLGVPKVRPTGPFRVVPEKALATELGVERPPAGMHRTAAGGDLLTTTRTKVNMQHGSWFLLDRDAAPGMPPELADLTFDDWVVAMDLLLPGFAACGKVVVPSTSARVMVDGQAMGSGGCHVFVRVSDPADLAARVWPQLLAKAFVTALGGVQLGFMKECRARKPRPGVEVGDVVARVPWSIFDPTVIGDERLVFDGAPTVRGKGLAVLPPDVRLIDGPILDTSRFVDLDDNQIDEIETRTGAKVEREKKTNGARPRVVGLSTTSADLELSTILETEDGDRTIGELWLDGAGHTRCQAPVRPESTSWNGFFNVHQDGVPFAYDNGTRCKHLLKGGDARGPTVATWIAYLFGDLDGQDDDDGAHLADRLAALGAAMGRHQTQAVEIQVIAAKLAPRLTRALGKRREQVVTMIARALSEAAKDHRPADAETLAEQRDLIDEINERYAVVAIGGSTRVVEPDAHNPDLGQRYARLIKVGDFHTMLSNRWVPRPNQPPITLGQYWLGHGRRRQYLDGVTLDPTNTVGPGYLNLWRGWAVEPDPAGDASWFLDHLAMLLAPQDGGFDYLLRWLASKIQNPGERGQTVVVLRGGQGTGKSFIGHAMRALFGVHAIHIANSSHLVNKFNAHLLYCLFLHCDEALFAGDRSHDRILKSLVTEDVLMVEPKGVDAVQQRNRLAILMTSNEDWVVPASADARRYCVFDVSDAHQNDQSYWRPLWAALRDPVKLGGLLHHLMTLDLDGFDVRCIPNTKALREQRIQSQPLEIQWLMESLANGRIAFDATPNLDDLERDPEDGGRWPEHMPTSVLYGFFESWCRQRYSTRYMPHQPMFAKTLARIFGPSTRPRDGAGQRRPRGYTIGPLDRARQLFAEAQGLEGHEW